MKPLIVSFSSTVLYWQTRSIARPLCDSRATCLLQATVWQDYCKHCYWCSGCIVGGIIWWLLRVIKLYVYSLGSVCYSTPLPWFPVLSNIKLPALRRKAATDKLLEKIVKHDSWLIQPDPQPIIATTDIQEATVAGLATKSWWPHNWKSAQVVNSHLICDPTTRQPGFDLPRQQWSLLNRFTRNKYTAVPVEGNGDLQTLICVLVARPRRYPTLSNPVFWQSWMAAYPGYTLLMKLFPGWPITWFMTRIWEEEEVAGCPCAKPVSYICDQIAKIFWPNHAS